MATEKCPFCDVNDEYTEIEDIPIYFGYAEKVVVRMTILTPWNYPGSLSLGIFAENKDGSYTKTIEERSIEINYCPICGRKLLED